MISILLIDIPYLTAAGLKYLIKGHHDLKVEASSLEGNSLHQIIEHRSPHIIILDYFNALQSKEELPDLSNHRQKTHLITISDKAHISEIHQMVQAGIKGFITVNCDEKEMIDAIYTVAKGERYFGKNVFNAMMEYQSPETPINKNRKGLTEREKEIIKLIAEGASTRQIADQLYLSHHTVNAHRKNIIKKLGIKSPVEIVRYAIEEGLINIR